MSLSKNEIKFLKGLQQKKFRDLEQLFVVEGIKLVSELLESDRFTPQNIYHLEDCNLDFKGFENCHIISNNDLERISGLKSPNQVLATVNYRTNETIDFKHEGCSLLLDRINDPGNLGTIIRTADWFGIEQIICSNGSVDMYNPKVVQASMGAVFRMDVMYDDLSAAIQQMKANEKVIYGADMDGENAFEVQFSRNCAILMGSESHGISDEIKSELEMITIPQLGKSESLNVGMAAGILMAEYVKSVKLNG